MTQPRIAFLGLGVVCSGMAHRLPGGGFPITVFDRNRGKAAPFAGDGAQIASSPQVEAADAKVIINMAADEVASRAMWLGDQGALRARLTT